MATVHGPTIPHHAGKINPRSRSAYQPPAASATVPGKVDPYYGHEGIARLCAKFITHLFACPEYPPVPHHHHSNPQAPTPNPAHHHPQTARLPYFIAYALHRTKLHPSVNFAALVLLQRLKARFPTAKGSSGHRLFISSFMIASKVMCDDTYSNKSWGIVAQGMFTLREINQMEREMCQYLEWDLNVDLRTLKGFESMVVKDFSGDGPYPTYVMSMFSKKSPKQGPTIPSGQGIISSASSTMVRVPPSPPENTSTSPIPSFGHNNTNTPPPLIKSPDRLNLKHQARKMPTLSAAAKAEQKAAARSRYANALAGSSPISPTSPSTPSPSHSNSTSPASSASPATPVGVEDLSAKIYSSASTSRPGPSVCQEIPRQVHPPTTGDQPTKGPRVTAYRFAMATHSTPGFDLPLNIGEINAKPLGEKGQIVHVVHPLKPKMFAFASGSTW